MNTSQALEVLLAGHEWSLQNNDLSTLIVHDGAPAPTQGEVDAYIAAHSYYDQRRKAYPPLADQLDALWKGGQAAADMLALVQAVKATYPKP